MATGLSPVSTRSLKNLTAGTHVGALGGAVSGIASDAQGNIWFTGVTQQNFLPGQANASTLQVGYFGALSSDGSTFLDVTPTPHAGQAMVNLPGGNIGVLGTIDSFLLSIPGSQMPLVTVAGSASNKSSGTIVPEELISLYGTGIGPSDAQPGHLVSGIFTNTLGGYQVLFDGTAAPLLYAGPNQFNVVVPQMLAEQQTTHIVVSGPQGEVALPPVYVAPARPQVFSHVGDAAEFGRTVANALNQDGTTNSPTNPAQPGSTVTIWATGLFGVSSALWPADGQIIQPAALYAGVGIGPVSVTTGELPSPFPPSGGGISLNVEYASDAPGQILGLTQINFQIPAVSDTKRLPIVVWLGGVRSDPVFLDTAPGGASSRRSLKRSL